MLHLSRDCAKAEQVWHAFYSSPKYSYYFSYGFEWLDYGKPEAEGLFMRVFMCGTMPMSNTASVHKSIHVELLSWCKPTCGHFKLNGDAEEGGCQWVMPSGSGGGNLDRWSRREKEREERWGKDSIQQHSEWICILHDPPALVTEALLLLFVCAFAPVVPKKCGCN